MKKIQRLISLLVTLTMLLSSLVGCSRKLSFSSETEMQEYLTDKSWVCETETDQKIIYTYSWYNITGMMNSIKFTKSADQSLEEMFGQMLAKLTETALDRSAYSEMTGLMWLAETESDFTIPKLDPETATATGTKGQNSYTYEFLKDGTMICNGETYKPDDGKLRRAFEDALDALKAKEKQAFSDKYKDANDFIDVRYSPYSYLGTKFIIEGTAELDDYFNYDYSDLEMVYFCIDVTPRGGSYADKWYIYADRQQHEDLLEKLKQGSISDITIVARGYYPDSLSEGMADLVDYYIG